MLRTVIVVPCYNEAQRLPVQRFAAFARQTPGVQFLFVNDGSTDDTLQVLHRLQQQAPGSFGVRHLACNRGKAEAVRQGCLAAFAHGVDYAGYWDADLATPLEAIPEFLQVFAERPGLELVCGARVRLLGRDIRRTRLRHYLGRAFATVASWLLQLSVYDTQCGAKLFRASPRITPVFQHPFHTRWLFDVEILARLIGSHAGHAALLPLDQVVYELPLREWHDVAGSKLRSRDFVRALFELGTVYRTYLRGGVRHAEAALEPRPVTPVLYTGGSDFNPAAAPTRNTSAPCADPMDRPLAA